MNYCDDPLWRDLVILETDYSDYGGKVVRWENHNEAYPDCSSGCRHFEPIMEEDGVSNDWGVCKNKNSPRHNLLTWEHQAGYKCYEN